MSKGTRIPEGYKKIKVHMVYEIKHDHCHKERIVADGHLTDIPQHSVHSTVISLRGLRVIIFLSEFNNLQIWTTDIGNAYLNPFTDEKVAITAGNELGDREGIL